MMGAVHRGAETGFQSIYILMPFYVHGAMDKWVKEQSPKDCTTDSSQHLLISRAPHT